MAHKKGAGSTKNGRDSNSNRLGVKVYGGAKVVTGNIIVPNTAFSSAPNPNSVWVLETTGGTSAQNLQTTQWRVVSVEEVDDLEYKVSALAYNSSKYGNIESGFSLTQRDFSNLNEIPSAPPSPLIIILLPLMASLIKFPIA